jgi:nitrile hydratase
LTDERHDHNAPANPFLEKRRNAAETEVLVARSRRLEDLLVSKGIVSKGALDKLVELYESDIGPMNGARVVARAWVDSDYKLRLMANATAAIEELGFGGMQGEHMIVVENSPGIHNVVVCTLCSCYPWPVLGLPPTWYKSLAYRSRVVVEPRGLLREFGLELPESVEVRVWDSSAEIRYLVLPERPERTAGWSEGELAALVTRDAMIGVTTAAAPAT